MASVHGGDPPCECGAYNERADARERNFGRNLVIFIVVLLAIPLAIFFLS